MLKCIQWHFMAFPERQYSRIVDQSAVILSARHTANYFEVAMFYVAADVHIQSATFSNCSLDASFNVRYDNQICSLEHGAVGAIFLIDKVLCRYVCAFVFGVT